MKYSEIISQIKPISNPDLQEKIKNHLDDLTKPPGSLGLLEEIVVRYCLCRNNKGAEINDKQVYTFAGDHGITEEKITPFPQEVTTQMVLNMANGGAAVSVMCKKAGIEYSVVDIGVKSDFNFMDKLIKVKIGKGTKNFANEPAMSVTKCENAFIAGYNIGNECEADLVGAGEMGIGNTSSASALYSLILDKTPSETTGAGTGSIGDLYEKKRECIEKAVILHKKEWDGSAFDALRRVGGFEIAGITGLLFGCAIKRIPVVIDGFIASAAALIAIRMNPEIKDYLFFAHESNERFHKAFLENEGIRPILALDMRLGEGTGSVLAIQIIEQAMECYNTMATFSSAKVSNSI